MANEARTNVIVEEWHKTTISENKQDINIFAVECFKDITTSHQRGSIW